MKKKNSTLPVRVVVDAKRLITKAEEAIYDFLQEGLVDEVTRIASSVYKKLERRNNVLQEKLSVLKDSKDDLEEDIHQILYWLESIFPNIRLEYERRGRVVLKERLSRHFNLVNLKTDEVLKLKSKLAYLTERKNIDVKMLEAKVSSFERENAMLKREMEELRLMLDTAQHSGKDKESCAEAV